MRVSRQVLLAATGIGSVWFNFHLALEVEEAYGIACAGHPCPSIADEMYLLKVGIVITAFSVPLALAWLIDRRNNGD